MKELRRNPDTGIVEVWEDGKKIGEIRTIGDEIIKGNDHASQSNR